MKRAIPLLAVLALTGCGGTAQAPAASTAQFPDLFVKARSCVVPSGSWRDDNSTLYLDGAGEGETAQADKATQAQRDCVFKALETPQSIVLKMGQTRAIDGRQEDSAGGFDYSWTFHPDSGLDLIITQGES